MPPQLSLWKFFGFCAVFMGIVLFCVAAGGYTSFYRSQNRIDGTKAYLTDTCKERLDLIPGLIEITKKSLPQYPTQEISQTTERATHILQYVISEGKLVDKDLVKDFEDSQMKLTAQLKNLLTQSDVHLDKTYSRQFADMKNQLITAQNNLFVTKKRYNDEVAYYNTRKTAVLTSFFAKLFGFDQVHYIELSNEPFLPAHQVFAPKTP
ncbi:LemA family protein [Desulfobacula sp.]|uniref:LemA family protein n=1 Tax=Desulfobacula sp. TaxID=2593537 RepID=UPI0026172C02|nr:LemA family protein [Desulfobacula sp.]